MTRGTVIRRCSLAWGLACLVAGLAAQTPAPSTVAPFFFLQMSDPQFGMFTQDKDFVQETVNFEMAIATANRLKPAFVVITGDLVNKAGDAAQIAEYRRITAKLSPSIPIHQVAGNHDVENSPTPESVAAYTKIFGPDHYTFTHQGLAGLVLNSSLIHTPDKAPELHAAQDRWLRDELARARPGVRHVVVFQHHPWFLATATERDQYYNIPLARRSPLLALFHEHGVKYLVSGHYHRNAVATDGDLTNVTSGPVGKPQGGENPQSGMRVFVVNDSGISHRFYSLGELPNQIDPAKSLTVSASRDTPYQ